MNRTNIEWCDYSWNPFTGCTRKCWYCYAAKLHDQRHKAYKEGKRVSKIYATPFDEPQFVPEGLEAKVPKRMPEERNRIAAEISPERPVVFVGSMGDIFEQSHNAIRKIQYYCADNPDVNFLFLTKKPEEYIHWDWTENCWLGCTITGKNDTERNSVMKELADEDGMPKNKVFLSAEPLLGSLSGLDLSHYSFIVTGALTGAGANTHKPLPRWVDELKQIHPRVYLKDSLI